MAKSKKPKITRSRYPEQHRLAIFDDYINTKLTMREIAEKHKTPLDTIMNWYQDEKWPAKKRELQQHIRNNFEAELLQIVMNNSAKVALRHLQVSEKLEQSILGVLERGTDAEGNVKVSARELSDLAKALKNSGDISARITQLDRAVSDNGGKPSINIGTALIQHGVKPMSTEKVIDIQPEESDF